MHCRPTASSLIYNLKLGRRLMQKTRTIGPFTWQQTTDDDVKPFRTVHVRDGQTNRISAAYVGRLYVGPISYKALHRRRTLNSLIYGHPT